MHVIIGVDPHKASHTAVAVDDREVELAQIVGPSDADPDATAVDVGGAVPGRMWAIEGANGMGYLLSQQLVAAGEHVIDVPATLAARTRVLGTAARTRTTRTTPCRSPSTALRHDSLRLVRRSAIARCCGCWRSATPTSATNGRRLVSRMHSLLLELAPGGIAKEINASDVDVFLARLSPATPVDRSATTWPSSSSTTSAGSMTSSRHRTSGSASRSRRRARRVTDLFGVGPIIAAMLIGYTGDITRFRNRDHYAAYNGTAPVEFSSGGRTVHRLSHRGNRNLNHASTWQRSASSANPTLRAAATSTARSPRARPRRKRSERSSARSATPSTANSSSTPPRDG